MDRPETYLAALENAPTAIVIVDAVNGQINAANRAAQSKLGYSNEQLLNRGLLDLPAPRQSRVILPTSTQREL